MTSLRARLLLVTVLVAAVAVVVSALFSRQVVSHEFLRFVGGGRPVDLAATRAALESRGSLARADDLLARESRRLGRGLVLADSSGAILATSAAAVRGARVRFGADGLVTIASAPGAGGARGGLQLELHRPPSVAVRAGGAAATLFVLPEPRGPEDPQGFLRGVNRGVWLGALAAIAVGAALVLLLAARIVGPIEAVTRAARRMEAGDLSARAGVHGGSDEVVTLARGFDAMAGSLERSASLRRQLTHDVAHELRTPLTNLRAQVEAIEDGLVEPDAAAMTSLHEEILLLGRLVDDLAELAEAEAGALKLDVQPLDAHEELARASLAFAARARQRGVTLEVIAPPGRRVRADALRLAQMLGNLVANALTHTPEGGTVRLWAADDDDGAHVMIGVSDTGPGIPDEHRPHVFERFYRVDPSRSRATGGSGLGLAIVRQLAILQGGEVRAERAGGDDRFARFESGPGARMVLRLPAA